MTLPQSYVATLVLMILGMLCWGSWANTFKLTRNWRFELFYFDFSLGVLLTAIVAAFTLGTMGSDGFQVLDDVLQTGKRNIFLGFLGGVVFNLGNMFLLAAISVAGMAMSFPVALGTALVTGVIVNYFVGRQGNPVLLFGGAAIVFGAIVMAMSAYKKHAAAKLEVQAKAGLLKTSAPKVSPKGIVLSLISGVLMGSFFQLVESSRSVGSGLGPYAIGLVFAVGVFASTFVFNLFFMNLPVQGEPVEVLDYIRQGNAKRRMLGMGGGMLWCAGAIATFVAAAAEPQVRVADALSYPIGQAAGVVGALWGLVTWKEYDGADFRVKTLLYVMLALFVCGLGMVSFGLR